MYNAPSNSPKCIKTLNLIMLVITLVVGEHPTAMLVAASPLPNKSHSLLLSKH